MSYTNLSSYYQIVFSMVQHHKYSITEIENIIPFERDLYVDMLVAHLEAEKDKNNG